jgi:arylsulfatase
MHARIAGERASWELYDLNNDRSERRNLAAEHPKKVAELVKAYETWTRRCLVEPYPGQKINQTK